MIPEPLLKGTRREYTIDRLIEMPPPEGQVHGDRQLLGLVLPYWQRPEVWSTKQKQQFVEGIFLGLGCGYYVTNGLDWDQRGKSLPMAGWLLDGQQRISTIRDFLQGDLVIFDQVTYQDLSQAQDLRFKRTAFPCFELDYTADESLLKHLYDRLNFGGTAHTDEQRMGPSAP